jgi:Flp pilus assembly protein TadG
MTARSSTRADERGATAVMVAVTIAALCALLGLALNVGHLMSVRSELQTAADSAALAGAQQLAAIVSPVTLYPDLSQAGQVTSQATSYSAYNPSDTLQLAINDGDVSIGIWDPTARSFTASSDATQVNAVQVNVARAASAKTGPVEIAMAKLLGSSATKDVSASAVAVVGGRCNIQCTNMPVAYISCGPPEAACGTTAFISIMNNSADGQWTDFDLGNGNPNVLGILQWQPGQPCPFAGPQGIYVGECVVNKVPGVRNIDLQYVQNNDIGKTFVIPLICNTDTTCTNGDAPIRSFINIMVKSVTRTGNNQGILVEVQPCGTDQVSGVTGGGGCSPNGFWYLRPRLVR